MARGGIQTTVTPGECASCVLEISFLSIVGVLRMGDGDSCLFCNMCGGFLTCSLPRLVLGSKTFLICVMGM